MRAKQWVISSPSCPRRLCPDSFLPTPHTSAFLLQAQITLCITAHSQLLNIIILKFNPPVLLNLLGYILPYCPAVKAIRRINSSSNLFIYQASLVNKQVALPEGQCWICNWECLYCDSSQEIRWNIAPDLKKSLGLCPRISLWHGLYFIVYPSSRHNTDTVYYSIVQPPPARVTLANPSDGQCGHCSRIDRSSLLLISFLLLLLLLPLNLLLLLSPLILGSAPAPVYKA